MMSDTPEKQRATSVSLIAGIDICLLKAAITIDL
jgi:hypothetical protein